MDLNLHELDSLCILSKHTIAMLSSLFNLFPRVDHWDLERERVVILTDNNIIVVKYNFIHQQVEELKYIPINAIVKAVCGEFQYPYSYAL